MDGSFSAKQCKGGKVAGRCFCHNEQGERIFGFDWWKNADNMTCGKKTLKFSYSSILFKFTVISYCNGAQTSS